jgi:predicted RNA-binding Zn-ribbon protein involved in translation (DUF1610 family)
MSEIVLGIAVVILLISLFFSACRTNNSTVAATTSDPPVTIQQIGLLNKSEIEKRLSQIEKRNAPEPKMGAMCYKVAAPPNRVEYVCPKCGEKTLYKDQTAYFIDRQLPACKRIFETLDTALKGYISLDESSFCRKCSPDSKTPELLLRIKYDDGDSHSSPIDSDEEIRMVVDFLKGKLTYTTSNDSEMPLKEKLPRLRKLMGVR